MVREAMIFEFLASNWKVSVMALAVCVTISLCLIARLWLTARRASMLLKLGWSVVLTVPFVGWLFFAAFYHAPARDENEGHVEYGGAAAGGGDFAPGSSGAD